MHNFAQCMRIIVYHIIIVLYLKFYFSKCI